MDWGQLGCGKYQRFIVSNKTSLAFMGFVVGMINGSRLISSLYKIITPEISPKIIVSQTLSP